MYTNWWIIGGYQRRENKEWERVRALAFSIAKTSGNLKNPRMTLDQFWPMGEAKEEKKNTPEAIHEQYLKQQAEFEQAKQTKKREVPKEAFKIIND